MQLYHDFQNQFSAPDKAKSPYLHTHDLLAYNARRSTPYLVDLEPSWQGAIPPGAVGICALGDENHDGIPLEPQPPLVRAGSGRILSWPVHSSSPGVPINPFTRELYRHRIH